VKVQDDTPATGVAYRYDGLNRRKFSSGARV